MAPLGPSHAAAGYVVLRSQTIILGRRAMSAKGILADSDEWNWRSNAYAWWVVIVLTLGLTLSLMDRMIIALMIGPIKHDLQLSDTQISLLQGLAFTLFYVTAGLPLGRLADRWNRRSL